MTPSPRPARLRELSVALLVAAVIGAGFVAIAAAHGALGISRNDDWVYYRIAFGLHDTGRLVVDPYTWALTVGQILASQPVMTAFGASMTALQIAVAVIGVVGLVATYAAVRHLVSPTWAAVSVLTLALGPIFGALSTTYMTDIPAFTLQVLALWAALHALRGDTRTSIWLALSLTAALAAFTVREYAAITAAVVVATSIWRYWGATRKVALLGLSGAAWLIVAFVIYRWRGTLPGAGSARPVAVDLGRNDVRTVALVILSLGFLATPAAVVSALHVIRSHAQRTRLIAVWTLTAVLAFGGAAYLGRPALSNYVSRDGSYPETLLGVAPAIFPAWLWLVLCLTSAVAAGALVISLVGAGLRVPRRACSPEDTTDTAAVLLCAAFVVSWVGGVLAVSILTDSLLFDRYLVPALPFVSALLLRRAATTSRAAVPLAAGLLTAWSLYGLSQVDAAATFDGAKWQLGVESSAQGYAPSTVDAGLEWFGYHQPAPIALGQSKNVGRGSFWLLLFRDPRVCVQGRYAEPGAYDAETVLVDVRARTAWGHEYHLVATPTDIDCRAG